MNYYNYVRPRKSIRLPCFTIGMHPIPSSTQEMVQILYNKKFQSKSEATLQAELDHVASDRNVHVLIPFDMRINTKRNKTLNRVKRQIFLDDYREIFPQDQPKKLFTYILNANALVASNEEITYQSFAGLYFLQELVNPQKQEKRFFGMLDQVMEEQRQRRFLDLYPETFIKNKHEWKSRGIVSDQRFQILNPMMLRQIWAQVLLDKERENSEMEKLQRDFLEVLRELSDPTSDLHIVVENKYNQLRLALRHNTKLFIRHEWDYRLKRILDMCLCMGISSDQLATFLYQNMEIFDVTEQMLNEKQPKSSLFL